MTIRTFATVAGVIALIGSLPVLAQAQTDPQTAPTTKHRLVGSYYWQQVKPAETKPELTPKHRLLESHVFVPQTKPQETKPEPKSEAKPATAATLAGKWVVSVETANGAMPASLDIKADPKDAKKVTGTIASQAGEAAFEGEVVDGKVSIWFKMNANGTEVSVTLAGAPQKDGSLAGTLNFGQGEIPWTATKEKK